MSETSTETKPAAEDSTHRAEPATPANRATPASSDAPATRATRATRATPASKAPNAAPDPVDTPAQQAMDANGEREQAQIKANEERFAYRQTHTSAEANEHFGDKADRK